MESLKKYDSTFTPKGKKEFRKECGSCGRMLPAVKYKMKYGVRDGIEGIIRNRCCRNCEGKINQESTVIIPEDSRINSIEKNMEEILKKLREQQNTINDLQSIIGSLTAKILKMEVNR